MDEHDENLDIDTSMELEASEGDVDAILAASIIEYEVRDVVGKVMAFIAQFCSSGENTQEYLQELSASHGCPKWELKLWVYTRWASLSDCFRVILALQKVSLCSHWMHRTIFGAEILKKY